jgi:hypothetical protein
MSKLVISPERIAMMLRQYKARSFPTVGDLKVIALDRNMLDVFKGEGWANRGRYRVVNGRWAHVTGIRLTTADIQLLPSVRRVGG